METQALGQWGEDRAARFLESKGVRVLDRNYHQPWGEIDLICFHKDTWIFVEVKTRSHQYEIPAVEAVGRKKMERLSRAIMSYMKWKRLEGQDMRIDLVLIEGEEIDWIQNAFELSHRFTY